MKNSWSLSCRLKLITLVSVVCACLVYEVQYRSVFCLATERQLLLLVLIGISDFKTYIFLLSFLILSISLSNLTEIVIFLPWISAGTSTNCECQEVIWITEILDLCPFEWNVIGQIIGRNSEKWMPCLKILIKRMG